LAYGITLLLNNNNLYETCRNNAIKHINDNFSLNREIKDFIELYNSLK
jgi:hypothetical protein